MATNYMTTFEKYESLIKQGNQLNTKSFDNMISELNGDKKLKELVSSYRHEQINNAGIQNFIDAVKKYVN